MPFFSKAESKYYLKSTDIGSRLGITGPQFSFQNTILCHVSQEQSFVTAVTISHVLFQLQPTSGLSTTAITSSCLFLCPMTTYFPLDITSMSWKEL